MKTRAKDRQILRDLAKQYMEVCERQQKSRQLWHDFNSLKKVRPPVYCMVFFATHMEDEIDVAIPPCETEEHHHELEYWLRSRLWASGIPDDSMYDPWYTVEAPRRMPSCGNWGIEREITADKDGKGWRCMSVVKDVEDLKKLVATPHEVLEKDCEKTRELRDIIGDILPVHESRSTIYPIWGGTDLSESAGALLGLQELLFALYEKPQLVHGLMGFMRDAVIANLKQGEKAGDWSLADQQNYSSPAFIDCLPEAAPNSYGAKLKDLWFFTHAQEFEGVGPDQHEEFLLNYQLPIMELFGQVNYGCCETLHHKIDLLRKIPNLRRILAGPRADLKRSAEQIGRDYCISWRPNPASMVSQGFDPDNVRKQIRQALRDSKGCNVEIVLKELLTVEGDLSRLFKWAQIARQEAELFEY